ncbi:MAG: SRPBCC domain-containing protein [Proteobacteria bacterium]|nr:SRPBCC domain-containing protein [Pseudomonadota bacterium]
MHKDSNGALTRRGLVAGGMTAIGVAAVAMPSLAAQSPARGIRKNAFAIHQEETFNATPDRIFSILVDAKQFAAMSGLAVSIDPVVGGIFSLFDGVIFGVNLEIVPNIRLVQAWSDKGWPKGLYSIARFALQAREAKTLLVFDHTGIPQDAKEAQNLARGWPEHYWIPLRKYLG